VKAAQKEGAPRIQWRRGRRKSARTYQKCLCCATSPQLDFVGRRLSPLALSRAQVADGPPRSDGLRGGDNGVGVDAIVPIKVGDRAGLAEMLDP
jgi:hypothetical protein